MSLAFGILSPRRRLVLWAALCAPLLVGCAAQEAPAPTYELADWRFAGCDGRQVETEHYRVRTTVTDERLLKTFPVLLESAFDYYETLAPTSREVAEPMETYLFAKRAEWATFTRTTFGLQRSRALLQVRNGGYSEQGVAAIQYVSHHTTFPLLAHEGFHQYMHHYVSPTAPAWLNEGLAVCCEGQRWSGDRHVTFDPWFNPYRANTLATALQRESLLPLIELLRTHAGEVISEPTTDSGVYYGQVWMLTLFLREGAEGKYAARFERLLERLAAGDAERRARAAFIASDDSTFNYGEYVFRALITQDLETFEREYLAFMKAKAFNTR